jgi:hypothetical protein
VGIPATLPESAGLPEQAITTTPTAGSDTAATLSEAAHGNATCDTTPHTACAGAGAAGNTHEEAAIDDAGSGVDDDAWSDLDEEDFMQVANIYTCQQYGEGPYEVLRILCGIMTTENSDDSPQPELARPSGDSTLQLDRMQCMAAQEAYHVHSRKPPGLPVFRRSETCCLHKQDVGIMHISLL